MPVWDKAIRDAYDAAVENLKHADGTPGNTNGLRVRLVPWDVAQKRREDRRLDQARKDGGLPEKQHVPFYPWHNTPN